MKTFSVSKRVLFAVACSALVQAGPICASAQASSPVSQLAAGSLNAQVLALPAPQAQSAPVQPQELAAWDATASVKMTGAQLEKTFDLAFRIMRNKEIYKAFNDAFASNVVKINARGNGLSLSQIVFVLAEVPALAKQLESVLAQPTLAPMNTLQVGQLLAPLTADPKIKSQIAAQNDPSRPLRLEGVKGGSGYETMVMYVGHPRLAQPGHPKSKVIPAQNLRKVVIDFIKGAKKEVMFNVFDFDLQPIADALIAQNALGVRVHGGVDKAVYNTRTEVKAVVDSLLAKDSPSLQMTLVTSVGLNHQKMIVRDAGTENAAILLLSGNFTQSCIGPEGDAVHLPPALRPKESVPNANHAIMIRGQIPAAVVKQELRKTLVYGIKGESNYPVGGAFQIMGPKPLPQSKRARPWMMLTFSPNGGLGNINRDILTRVIRETRGPVIALHFAFSSDILQNEIVARIQREAERKRALGLPATNLFFSVGDTPFAMQYWSVFLGLSGFERDQITGKYSPLANDPLRSILNAKELEDLRSRIRIAPRLYGERHVPVAGQKVKLTAKIHHKVFIFPESEVSVVGTSFNPSASAESNQEQVMVVRDPEITRTARGMFEFLYRTSASSVSEEVERRSKLPSIEKEDASEDGVEKSVVQPPQTAAI